MIDSDSRERFLAAHKLFLDETTTLEKFESARTLIQGINPKVDKALDSCSKAIQKIENLRKGEVIELAAGNLSERTEEEKKRKKAIVWFIRTWKQLQSEVERIKAEFEKGKQE